MIDKRGITVLIAGSILQLFFGIIYVWSVFVLPVSAHYSWAVDSVKLTSSFMLSCFVLGILGGGKMQLRYGTHKMVLVGGILTAAGMLTASFTPLCNPWFIYVAYGVIGGFGVGVAYNAIITCAQKWFPRKRGLATGVSVSAFGFSTVIFAPLTETLIANIGLLNTLRVFSAAFALVTVIFFRFLKLPETISDNTAAVSADESTRQYTTTEMLRTGRFFLVTLSLVLGTATYFILNPAFKTLALERGLAPATGTALVMITGIANAAGRLSIPIISDKLGRELSDIIIIAMTAAAAFALCVVTQTAFIVAVAVIAFSYGGLSGIYPLLTGDQFGTKNAGANYGAVMCGFALSALFLPMMMGLIIDVSVKFVVLGIMAVVGGIMVSVLLMQKKLKNKEPQKRGT